MIDLALIGRMPHCHHHRLVFIGWNVAIGETPMAISDPLFRHQMPEWSRNEAAMAHDS